MLTFQVASQVDILDEDEAQSESNDREAKVEGIEPRESVLVGLQHVVLVGAGGQLVQHADVALGLFGDLDREPEPPELECHDVLERRPADADAERHAELPDEGIHGGRRRLVALLAHGLRSKVLRVQDGALPGADDQVCHQPDANTVVMRPYEEQPGADARDEPADADGPAVVVVARHEAATDDAGPRHRQGCRQHGHARIEGGVSLYG